MASGASAILTLTEANFADVVARSRQLPVLVDFWADWCAPCKQITPILEKLAAEWAGRVIVAKVNADQEPLITQQFGVRGLPTLKLVFQGQIAGELVGAHPEPAIRKLVAPVLDAGDEPADAGDVPDFHAQVQSAIDEGYLEDAIAALQAQLGQQPDDKRSREMLGELLVTENRLDEAATVLADGGDAPELKRVRALLGFARRIEGLPTLDALEATVRGGAAGSEDLYRYALRLVGANRLEDGMDILLQVMRSDRAWGDDAARKALLDIFEMLGREDPLTVAYRRRMASMLY